ncbi:agmatine deiminase family protein [Sphingobium sufflavum]|uniref:agmatine deiminase family protein n=1 Tax=Sphingobium sufflavum TaxID=1129547 RepID=UPI001F219A52|nr:agmatine deiminase family protein [Sphingobium sufflavum]MCE7796833.1 agmatine deiminase family protein [Sphingobium sufflavum]
MTYRMPAEWALHDWLWIGFPGDPAEWPQGLAEAQAQVAAFARAVHADGRGESVRLVARTEGDAAHARPLAGPGIDVIVEPFGDIWLRDTGPIGTLSGAHRALAGFGFNGWGGKYDMPGDQDIGTRLAASTPLPFRQQPWVCEGGALDTDGTGLFVTTEQCLLNPNRNPSLDRGQITTLLTGALGLSDMLWLGDGLLNDHTDGHVDNLARFVAPGVLAVPQATTPDDPNTAIYDDAAARAAAHGVEVARLPSVGLHRIDGDIVPASYMNFLIGNAAVVVPLYGAPNDGAAVEALKPFFPGRDVVGVPSFALLRGGGSFHCCSQQMPSAS